MANVNLQGSIIVLSLYDIAEEIRLSDLPPLIGGTRLSSAFKHPAPAHVRFERPPVIEPSPLCRFRPGSGLKPRSSTMTMVL